MAQLLRYITFLGFGLSITVSLGQILVRQKDIRNYALSLFFFSLAVIEFASFNTNVNLIYLFPHLSFADLPFIFCLGPSLYVIFYETLLNNDKQPRYLYHFILPVLVTGFTIPYYALSAEEKYHRVQNVFNNGEIYLHESVYGIGVLITSIYIVFLLSRVSQIFHEKERLRQVGSLFITGLLAISAVVVITVIIGMALHIFLLFRISASLIFLFVLANILIGYRRPDYYQNLIRIVRYTTKSRSQLENINISTISKKLDALMTDEKIFLEEDLNLPKLAAKLHINIHQLSELLNKTKQISFSEYINSYRIQQAIEILRDSEMAIAEIGYRCGFHSLSAFQRAFDKNMHCTPGQYRKEHNKTCEAEV